MFTQCLKRVNLSSKPNILMKRRGVSFFSVLILEKLIRFLFRALEETYALFYGLNRKEEKCLHLIMHEFLTNNLQCNFEVLSRNEYATFLAMENFNGAKNCRITSLRKSNIFLWLLID